MLRGSGGCLWFIEQGIRKQPSGETKCRVFDNENLFWGVCKKVNLVIMDLDVVDNVLHLLTYFHVDCFKKPNGLF